MIKIIFLAVSITIVIARPGFLHGTPELSYYEYEPTVVGHSLHAVPSAVSHQSQTIIHEKRPYLKPIITHAPILNTYDVPVYAHNTYGLYDGWNGAAYTGAYGGWNPWG